MTIDEALVKLKEFGTPEEIAGYLELMGFKGEIRPECEDMFESGGTLCPLEIYFLEQTGLRVDVYGDFIIGPNGYAGGMSDEFTAFVQMFDQGEFPELIIEQEG